MSRTRELGIAGAGGAAGWAARGLLTAMACVGASLFAQATYAFDADACIVERGGNSCTANEGGAITAVPVACASLSAAEVAANTNGCLTPATPSCVEGSDVPIKINAGLAANNADRYDVGLYISTDDNKPLNLAPAAGGADTCFVTAVPIPPGSDLDGDTCGDQTAKTAIGNLIPLATTIKCVPGLGGDLALQIGATYQQNTTETCSLASGATQVFPGTGSKCNSNSLTLPIDVIVPTGAVTLVKALVPTTDPGLFDLTVGDQTATDQGHNGSVTKTGVTAGTSVTLSEDAGTDTDLANYTKTIVCATTGASPVTVPTTGSAPSWTLTMPEGAPGILCTLTNTRIGKSVRVEKNLSPGDDPGLFNLLVNGSPVATNAGNGDAGTLTGVAVGSSVTVAETAGTGTNLGNYTSSLACTGVTPPVTGTTSGTFTMPNADVNCVFTNTRKTHDVTVQKSLSPTDDPGLFNLLVNGSPVTTNATNGGSGTATGVPVGSTVQVSETAGTGTSPSDYTSSLSCTGASASGTTSGTFTMPDNNVTCTFTNTRRPPAPPQPIPVVGAIGLAALAMGIGGLGLIGFRRRK